MSHEGIRLPSLVSHALLDHEKIRTRQVAAESLPSLVSHAEPRVACLAAQVEEEAYQLKPMNCPFHVLMYRNTPRSYKSLPLRSAAPAPLRPAPACPPTAT